VIIKKTYDYVKTLETFLEYYKGLDSETLKHEIVRMLTMKKINGKKVSVKNRKDYDKFMKIFRKETFYVSKMRVKRQQRSCTN